MKDTATFALVISIAVYVLGFSYYLYKELKDLFARVSINELNDHAFGDYVDDNLHTIHRRIDDLETLLLNANGKRTVNPAVAKAVNTTRAVAKKAEVKKAAKKTSPKKSAKKA